MEKGDHASKSILPVPEPYRYVNENDDQCEYYSKYCLPDEGIGDGRVNPLVISSPMTFLASLDL